MHRLNPGRGLNLGQACIVSIQDGGNHGRNQGCNHGRNQGRDHGRNQAAI